MKHLVFLFALTMGFSSCRKQVSLLEGLGNVKSPSGTWAITLEPDAIKVSWGDGLLGAGKRETYSVGKVLEDWKTETGAFVYFDPQDQAWVFNGASRGFVGKRAESNTTFTDFHSYKGSFPPEVTKRLPTSLAKQYQEHGQ